MPFFQYTVKNDYGDTIKGRVEANSLEQAAAVLRNRSLLVISLRPATESSLSSIKTALFGVKSDEIVSFTRQLATMITAGLTLTEALHIQEQQSTPAMQKLIGDILREIEGGSSFSKALAAQGKYFSSVYIQLIHAGETAGVLDTILNRLADNLEKQREFRAKVKGALIYPVIVILAMIAVGFVMMVFVIPKLTQMYKELGTQLPLVTQLLIDLSNFMAEYWWVIIAVVAAGGFSLRTWIQTEKGRLAYDKFLLKLPILGPLREKVLLTEFCRTIGLMLGAGISMLQALDIISSAMDNKLYENALRESIKQVEKGVPLSQTIGRNDFFPAILPQMISVGEETGKIDDVMIKLSLYFETESDHAVKNLTAAFEPMIMLVLGISVGVLVIAIIMPIYNITTSL